MLSIWAMPGPSSECFVMTKTIRRHKIVKGGKLQKSEPSLICVIIAEAFSNALPVSTSIFAHFCIPVSLHNKNVILRCLINDILQLVIEFFYFVVVIVWHEGIHLLMLKGTALRWMVMSLLGTARHPMTLFTMSLWTRRPLPCSCLSSFLLKKTLCPSSVVVSPKFFNLISQSPRMFHLYLSISCVTSWSFPAALSVLVF